MSLFAIKSLSEAVSLADAEADRRTARRVGQYKVSDEALYLPAFPGTRYLPFAALSRVLCKNTSIHVTGSCGKALPAICLRAFYDGEFYQDFIFEKEKEVDTVLKRIVRRCPDVSILRDISVREF